MRGQCPNCKGLFEIKQEWIGMKAPCPHCHQTITLLAMPTAGSPAASSINLDKGDSTPATPPSESVAQNQAAPAQAPASAPVDYKLAPQAPASAPQYQQPPAQAPANTPMHYQQPPVYAGGQQYGGTPQLASIFERFIAMIIDGVIVGVGTTIIGFVIGLIGGVIVGALSAATGSDGLAALGTILINLLASLISMAICFGYEGYFLSTSGATIGKKVMGLRVLHAGQNPTFLRGGCRYLAKGISFFICMIGYIMACFTQDNKALHDMICDTIVVKG